MTTSFAIAAFLASHMVVQHSQPWTLVGTDAPGARVNASFRGVVYSAVVASDSGSWSIEMPVTEASNSGDTVTISSSSGGTPIVLEDVVFGEVYVCSGQSNMQLAVSQTNNSAWEIARSSNLPNAFRIMQVALDPSYYNVTTPQSNLSVSIPWGRVSPQNVPYMSAVCYYFGVEQVERHPTMPVGLIASSWGGTAIEAWMTPKALASCGVVDEANVELDAAASIAMPSHFGDSLRVGAPPVIHSTLWNSMLAPLAKVMSVTGWLWYQGEANANNPERYICTQPAMIAQFRESFQNSADAPFAFVQVSAWPAYNNGLISGIRYAQAQTLKTPLANVAMVVAADIGDPAGAYHPIHPAFKQEVSRRLAVQMARIQKQQLQNKQNDKQHEYHEQNHKNTGGPKVVSAVFDNYEASWGAYHHGSGLNPVCGINGWLCGGIRITFDQDIQVKGASGWHSGSRVDNGFELWNDQFGEAALGGTSAGSRQILSTLCRDCSKCPCMQPLEFSGIIGPRTVQLNTTFVSGKPATVRYAWKDYPNMIIYSADADELPAPPFNVSLSGLPN